MGTGGMERREWVLSDASLVALPALPGGTHPDVGKVSHRSDPVAAITVCALSFFFFF